MKNEFLIILSLALAATVTFGVISRNNLIETRAALEAERTSHRIASRDLESVRRDYDRSTRDSGREIERLMTRLAHAEVAEESAASRLDALDKRYMKQIDAFRGEISSLKIQRDEMEAGISSIRTECDARVAEMAEILSRSAEEAATLRRAIVQMERQREEIRGRDEARAAFMTEEMERLRKELKSTDSRSKEIEKQLESFRIKCDSRLSLLNEQIELKDQEIERLGGMLKELERGSARLEDRIISLTEIWQMRLERMKEEVSRLSDHEKNLAAIQSLLEEERKKNELLSNRSSQLEGKIHAFEKEAAENLEILTKLTNSREQDRKRVAELEEELLQANTSFEKLQEKIMNASSTMESLRAETTELRKKTRAKEQEIEAVRNTYESLVADLRRELDRREIRIQHIEEMISLEVVDSILFPPGAAAITSEGERLLGKVGDVLKGVENRKVRVIGHTDDIPIRAEYRRIYPTNWELSAARACAVVRFFQHRTGLSPSILEPVGRSFYDPVADNVTPEGRALNRRVTITIGPALEKP